MVAPCGHYFCEGCVGPYINERSEKCPECKTVIDMTNMRRAEFDFEARMGDGIGRLAGSDGSQGEDVQHPTWDPIGDVMNAGQERKSYPPLPALQTALPTSGLQHDVQEDATGGEVPDGNQV